MSWPAKKCASGAFCIYRFHNIKIFYIEIIDCLFHLETHSNEAILPGAGSVRVCRVRQWCGRVSRLWRPLHSGVGIPGRPRLGVRKGNNRCFSLLYLQFSIFRAEYWWDTLRREKYFPTVHFLSILFSNTAVCTASYSSSTLLHVKDNFPKPYCVFCLS